MENDVYVAQVEECVAFLKEKLPFIPETIIQLGTGLGSFGDHVESALTLEYKEIPHFPQSTVESHHGKLILGYIHNHKVAVLQGRFHYYEGYSTKEVAFPIRVLSLLGAKNLLLTNAAGGLNPGFQPGTIMIIKDHLNFLGENPLRGPNVDSWGPRFPDLSEPYSPALRKIALTSGTECSVENLREGVYVCIPGPSLETPAETRFLRDSGADGVGMSSIPEVLVATHGGMNILGISVVSNVNDPDNFKPILLEDIIETAAQIEPVLKELILKIVEKL